jgi:hypothetical protein
MAEPAVVLSLVMHPLCAGGEVGKSAPPCFMGGVVEDVSRLATGSA